MLKAISLPLIFSLSLISSINAGESDFLQLKSEIFHDANKVDVFAPALLFKKHITPKISVKWEQEFDGVTGASRSIGKKISEGLGVSQVDGVTGATPEQRNSTNIGVGYNDPKGRVLSGSVYFSTESDYQSWSPAFAGSMDFFERNLTLGGSASFFFDRWTPEGRFDWYTGNKRIQSYSLSVSQLLSSLTVFSLSGNSILSKGLLGHPYNPVVDITGKQLNEEIPSTKVARAITGQLIQGYTLAEDYLGSVNFSTRYYNDTWGVSSWTYDTKWSQYFSEESYFRLRLRYYNQGGARFSKTTYLGTEKYKTADIRFFPFKSLGYEAKVVLASPESWDQFNEILPIIPSSWDFRFNYTTRNTHGDDITATDGRTYLYQLYDPSSTYYQWTLMAGIRYNL